MSTVPGSAAPEITRIEVPGGLLVRVRGVLDGSFHGFGIPAGYNEELVLDLDGVQRVTSAGVRGWLSSKVELERASAVWLARVPPCVVAQLNAVAGFAGKAAVVSLYLPYLCSACGEESRVLLDLRQNWDVVLSRPGQAPCPKCGTPADLDEDPGVYLGCVARAPRPVISAVAARLLREDVGRESTLMVEKDLAGTVTHVRLSGPLRGRQRLSRRLDGIDGTVLVDLTHVTGVDGEGAADLAAALRGATANTWFTGASREVLDALSAAGPELLQEKLVSARVVVHCAGGCTATVARVTAANGGGAVACPRCGRASTIERTAHLDRALAKVVDPEIEASLSGGTRETGTGRLPSGFAEIRRLGVGGMAEVFLARRTGPGSFAKLVAVKRILPGLSGNQKFRALFQREARVAALISHPNVVQTFELLEREDQLLLVMEFVDGWDLGWLLIRARALGTGVPTGVAVRIALDLFAGLAAAHSATDAHGQRAAVIHRDISPHNLLVSREGMAKVADFGVAKSMGESGMDTRSAVMGKLSYMAAEQIDPTLGTVSPATDVYSGAVLFYELLAGKHPFERGGALESIQAVLHAAAPPLALADAALGAALAPWFERAMARPPARRFADAGEALDALRRTLPHHGVAGPELVASWAIGVADSCLPATSAQDSSQAPSAVPEAGVALPGDRTQVLSEEDLAVDDS